MSATASSKKPASGRIVLFNGETWEWNGARWLEIPPARPRAGHVSYDAARARVVLFGGDLDNMWEWDGMEWTQRSPTPTPTPPPRTGSAMVYDAARGRVVLFGGLTYGPSNDTWEGSGARRRRLLGTDN